VLRQVRIGFVEYPFAQFCPVSPAMAIWKMMLAQDRLPKTEFAASGAPRFLPV